MMKCCGFGFVNEPKASAKIEVTKDIRVYYARE